MGDSNESFNESDEHRDQRTQHVEETRTVIVNRQTEVKPRRHEQPARSSRRQDDDDDDDDDDYDDGQTPRSEAVVVSKTPREKMDLRSLQSQLPDRTEGGTNVRPGSVQHVTSFFSYNNVGDAQTGVDVLYTRPDKQNFAAV